VGPVFPLDIPRAPDQCIIGGTDTEPANLADSVAQDDTQ
jgi:hypothetical protein